MGTGPRLEEVAALVEAAARAELVPRFRRVARAHKADGSVVTEADTAMERRVREALAARWPGIPFLGEEMPRAEQERLLAGAGGRFWCLDPLDGTSNFASGIPFFSVSLALVEDGAPVLGVVHDPARGETFAAARGGGATLDGTPLAAPPPAPPLERCIALVDLKRLEAGLAARLAAERPYASQRSFGSVALDWCWIAAGRGHVYVHGRQRIWDFAAGSLILAEAGGRSCTLEGEPVFRPTLEGRSAVAALDPALFGAWCRWLGVPDGGGAGG